MTEESTATPLGLKCAAELNETPLAGVRCCKTAGHDGQHIAGMALPGWKDRVFVIQALDGGLMICWWEKGAESL